MGVEERLNQKLIPASPYRRPDSAMIGSLAALYPLRLYPVDDERLINTVQWLINHSRFEDAFFHHIAHSGCGTYLTMHLAHCLMYNKKREAILEEREAFRSMLERRYRCFLQVVQEQDPNPILKPLACNSGFFGFF